MPANHDALKSVLVVWPCRKGLTGSDCGVALVSTCVQQTCAVYAGLELSVMEGNDVGSNVKTMTAAKNSILGYAVPLRRSGRHR